MPDLRQSGSYGVTKKTVSFDIDRVRQTQMGFATSYSLDADIYLPRDLTEVAPLAILTHGFTSDRLHFNYLAKHLASHGYVVLVPEHIGSNKEYRDAFLRGELSVDISPIEFYSRPLDITFLLDELKNNSEFKGLIDWEQVGILGHSFGGTTALAVSGAPLNLTRISKVCQKNRPSFNVSILLQCRANYLPPVNSNLRDPRIKAVAVVNPVTSSILGPESMSKIAIPTMILAGSKDIMAPFIEEQAHPFLWLTTQNKYLGVMVGGNHNSTSSEEGTEDFPEPFKGSHSELGRGYLKAMSLAFFETHLRDRSDYKPYLSSAYAKTISNEKLPLYLIKSLTPKQLKQAYGSTPPTPPIPESIVEVSPRKKENVLAQIRNTKTLKVAMRTDSAPFGYVDPQKNLWMGYCEDLADSLGQYLAQKLNVPSGEIKVIKLPSSLENRFELVRKNIVHLECGPNTIRTDKKNIRFSEPFFVSGTRFLVSNDNASKVNLKSNLAGIKTGVLRDSTTAKFVQETYPQAKIVYLQGEKGRTKGVQAVTDGRMDAFVSDGVLLAGEITRQNLSQDNYQLIPAKPLTCDFYGLVLPDGQSQWENTVNVFLRFEQLQNKWLGEHLPKAVYDADYCLNQRRK